MSVGLTKFDFVCNFESISMAYVLVFAPGRFTEGPKYTHGESNLPELTSGKRIQLVVRQYSALQTMI